MNLLELILKKKSGQLLSREEIRGFVQAVASGSAADYQASALLMAICFQHLSEEETYWLTEAMLHSGEVMDLSDIPGIKVDKHSTGGVGDKTSLIVGPAAAALGIPVAKMSGRGLGHTGGTLDKLESIPGLKTDLSREAFVDQVRRIGLAIAGQTAELVPADKKLYALRDVSGTVDEISLIASSIMSKKLASGADKIVLDVKCGSGAFMKNPGEAERLAKLMIQLGNMAGKETRAVVSNMDQPLGNCVGNRLEVWESLEVLEGRGPSDLRELCRSAVGEMAELAGVASEAEGEKLAAQVLRDGSALQKFYEMVEAQGGDTDFLTKEKLLASSARGELRAEREGWISSMQCEEIGRAAAFMGAGRQQLGDSIDPTAGLIFHKKIGDQLLPGDLICEVQAADKSRLAGAIDRIRGAIKISDQPVQKPRLILSVLR